MKRAAAILLPLLLLCARSASSAPLQVATPTDFVPAGGAFTAAALLRVDGYAPIPERMEWRNGMALCCGSGYYDGFRLLFHDESEFRPVFEIGRPQGAVALEASSGISTGGWHHVAISWEPVAPSATNSTARLWVDGQLAAVSAPNIPAPILRGEPLVAEGTEGIRGLTLSNAMYLSSWLNETVEIPFDEDLFLRELNRRRNTSVKKQDKGIVFSTEGTY